MELLLVIVALAALGPLGSAAIPVGAIDNLVRAFAPTARPTTTPAPQVVSGTPVAINPGDQRAAATDAGRRSRHSLKCNNP
jgi:hypothetical protein